MQPEIWNEDVAQQLADNDGTGKLTAKHWDVINFIREYYQENEMAPMVR